MERILNKETIKYLGKEVRVSGWVSARRDHGKIIFIDLRDKSGILQVVFTPSEKETYNLAQELRPEWVIEIIGKINERPKKMENENLVTGKIELEAKKLRVLSKAETIPFSVATDGYEIGEEKRLKYRYIDLRRQRLRKNLETRQKVIFFVRDFLSKKGFLEVETPILTKSTPEGARDFLVPARLYPGKFYALPQSPQQYKQLLMVAGIENYFQIAKCLRDEDPRADRQAEHTQIDIETSFVEKEEDILPFIEEFSISLVKKLFPEKKIKKIPFPRIPYKEAIKNYKSDKPDLRNNKKDKNELAFAFITDFPLFEWHKEEKRWGAMHHPFTKPKASSYEELKENPEKILAYQYDLVLNGYEIGGGSVRTIDPKMIISVFEVLGHSEDKIKEQFGHLLEAFSYGVPPHGGIAIGLERLLSILLDEPNIREVIAFPKTGDNRDLMMDAPSEVSLAQLKELSLEIKSKKKTKE